MSSSLFLVGACSFLYHATLRQTLQFSDDISMLFLAGTILQRLYCAKQPQLRVLLTTVAIFAGISAMSVYYMRSGNLLMHTSMFAGMLTLIWPRTLYLISQRSVEEKSKHWRKFKYAVGSLVVAFLLWNVDLEMCKQLRDLRNTIGLPWAWVLELHGWWHILTAVGAAVYMDLVRDLCA
jgi:dihydroceramidase